MKLKEITPEHLRCQGGECPAVYAGGEDGGDLVIIGKRPSEQILGQLSGKVGSDEHAIVIDRAYFANVPGEGGGIKEGAGG